MLNNPIFLRWGFYFNQPVQSAAIALAASCCTFTLFFARARSLPQVDPIQDLATTYTDFRQSEEGRRQKAEGRGQLCCNAVWASDPH